MERDNEVFASESAKGVSIKEVVLKYLAYFPLFIVSFIICVGAGYLYIRYTVPKFSTSTLILVKGTQGGSKSKEDLVGSALTGELQGNLSNELISLRSSGLMERVVAKNGFNIYYYHIGKFNNRDLYLDAPFRLVPQHIADSSSTLSITLKNLSPEGGIIEAGPKNQEKKINFKWNTPLKSKGFNFTLVPRGNFFVKEFDYNVRWVPVERAAGELSSKLSVAVYDPKTSIIQLHLLIENMNRGKDVLNSVVREYNLADIEDRNILSQNTIRFIDDRLSIISRELGGVESTLETYQGSNEIIDISTQSGQAFGNSDETSKTIKELNVQQRVARMIIDYFNNEETQDKLVPTTMGLNDPTLSGLISRYNELQLQKGKESAYGTSLSVTIRDLNNQINNVRGSVLEALQNLIKNLSFQESNLQQQNSQYRQFLSSLPRKERGMQEIKRKQSVTEGLYLYMLQKREESAITSTSANISNYKQIDAAKGFGPVEPNATNIKLYTALLGLLLPIGFIYLRDMLNDKITGRDDISKKLPIPFLGDLGHVKSTKLEGLSVMDRDVISEQFRIIRTNLSLLKNTDKQVILVTSSTSAEGKTFVSTNLAAVLAIPGRRVALLEFDLRKPNILRSLGLEPNVPGITNYVKGKATNLSEIRVVSDEIPSLHIYPSGPIPVNPGDLLINEKVGQLLRILRQEYDYIIIDSAPVGIVSDALILGELSDIALYVIRQRVTLKKQLDFVNDIYKANKLKNMGLILNDVKTGGKYGYYGYGNSEKYESYKETKRKKTKLV
jgi:capsular exopolysaccharide synthesis family protein